MEGQVLNQMMKVEYLMDVASRTLNRCLVVYATDAMCFCTERMEITISKNIMDMV